MSRRDPNIITGTEFNDVQSIEDSGKANHSSNSGSGIHTYSVAGAWNFDTDTDKMTYENNSGSDVEILSAASLYIVGEVKTFAMALPSGWLAMDGSAISRTTYADLFSAIGTTFGVGDGSTTFNLPDTQGRTILDDGSGSGLTARTIADSSGAETHQLTESELAAHSHDIIGPLDGATGGAATRLNGSGTSVTVSTENTGGDTAHNNMQPYLVLTMGIYSGV